MKKNAQKRYKYFIICSQNKKMYGVFPPSSDGESMAKTYIKELEKKHPNTVFTLNKVNNLNKFLSSK
jgi:hypothetical protein